MSHSPRHFFWSLLTAGFLTACAVPPARVGEGMNQSAAAAGFDLVARFSLQLNMQQPEEARHFSGRLEWRHGTEGDRLLFLDPLGQGVAELRRPLLGPVVLQLADGQRREAGDTDELLAEFLGAPLPLGDLAAWVQARTGPGALVEPDELGRPKRVRESGWLLNFTYGDGASLPSRLDASLDGLLKLRLSMESWEPLP